MVHRLFCFLMLILILCSSVVHAALINSVVGTVAGKVVTLRDIRVSALLENALYPVKKPADLGPGPSGVPAVPLEATIDSGAEISRGMIEWAVYFEAQSFKAVAPAAVELRSIEQSALSALSADPAAMRLWQRLAVSEKELSEAIDRKVRAKKLVEFRSSASRVAVSDAEALRYFQKNKNRFGDRPFSQFKETIRGYLSQSQSDSRMRSWFEVLRRKHDVKLMGRSN
jgi:hypothetical protein